MCLSASSQLAGSFPALLIGVRDLLPKLLPISRASWGQGKGFLPTFLLPPSSAHGPWLAHLVTDAR
jgi:hypothetical protein